MGKYIWPLPGHSRISSKYGNRVCPFHGKEFHDGIDIPATSGTPIIAFAAGEGHIFREKRRLWQLHKHKA